MTAEKQQRAAVVAEAMTWLRTPYHHQASIKGAGVDCAMILVEVYHACGLIPKIDPRPYPPDWHFHRDEERYLGWIEQHAHEVEIPHPGDIALYKFGRCVSHAAIIINWPTIIHAYKGEGVTLADGKDQQLGPRLMGFYSLWSDE